MATLEFIEYTPQRLILNSTEELTWVEAATQQKIRSLPMIYWDDGSPWNEANHWAHERATGGYVKLKTIQDQMRHLHKFAQWLETKDAPDWRHFPMNRADRVLVKWRGYLIKCRDELGILAPSTTTARMNACINFYSHCAEFGFISHDSPKWKNIPVIVRYHDTAGFKRTLSRVTTDISIKSRVAKKSTVEEGLLPITGVHMQQLLDFASHGASQELQLMLKLGFFTGARLQTICNLKIGNLERAVPDPDVEGLWCIAVGPGSRPFVETKFDVAGMLRLPEAMLLELKSYAYSVRRMKRQARASKEFKELLLLTTQGNPYERRDDGKRSSAVNSEMVNLRRNAVESGMKFMVDFRFHQTRATYGTLLMKTLLPLGNLQAALEFVRNAMFHKEISTTMTYVKFIEQTKAKVEVANAYTQAFFDLAHKTVVKDW
ncbi:Site-specific integrase [Comamonas aquatilis]|uniref:site-specific integrase n=1 Tax=Comamonas aquatilis TaxID=1778406 RepID=UPI0039EDED5C